ncbi:GNAT family N-acetyltransferase [Massilia sp. DD77]|uniref:GNAT family N-acetyltransferase n=1 Tax=Massilia sp. DD77 TaxID=3109349 RepID=UPI002FFDB4CB
MSSSPCPGIRTARFVLRGFREDDLPRVFRGLGDPRVIAHYGVSYATLEATRAQMRWFQQLETEGTGKWWAICPADEPGQLIGACGVNDIVHAHRRAELGYWLFPEYWGQGIAHECVAAMIKHVFDTMPIYRIGAEVEVDNEASARLLRKLGFSHEGTRRAYEFKNGAPLDLQLFSLLASDRR